MRNIVCIASLCLAAAGCVPTEQWLSSTPDGKTIEAAILWQAKLDDLWTPVDMANVIKNTEQFQQQGNFYEVKGDLVLFGHRATYVGMLGVDMFAGPNAVLTGTPESIVSYITQRHGARFEKHGDSFVCDYKKDVKLIVEEHPNIRGSSIIIGAYTGL